MIYVNYDENTREIKAYYDDEISDFIPEPNFTISEKEHSQALSINANYVTNELRLIYKEKELSIDELKELKLNELESLKSSAENADILYKDKFYQADSKAKELLTQSLVIFSSVGAVPDNFVWKSSDNYLNIFGLDDLKNLSLLIAQRLQIITTKYWTYKEQIRNAENKESLDVINLEFN
ncbi:DUF4376 domain-containing protein [Campylobacter sp. RM9334]|uniref:DUF4376 domain-containing protein n=1 Tax=Campylobacter sp. RM9334 TaxID=2735732 RepID=UPI001D322990|nr:DUF4376 domain-containing protein [Campylobacter sp. RM9334]